ncbi:hypothetical protein F0U60_00335 [Archangium minus]|uniref:Lipoprotein n=1 Tax=Archangium minus TaxID=83450 RepID=A0ABY9WLW5_9BACT|nr:hypothetical protein F0U60_00335 [Archangium minus]
MSRHTMLMTLMGGLVLGTGCPDVYGKGGKLDRAMEKDINDNHDERKREWRNQGMEDDEEESCPEGKVKVRDCISLPCKVECK